MSKTPETETFEQIIEKLPRGWWHEVSCPAHSSTMRPESECECLLGAVLEDMDKVLAAHTIDLEAARIDELERVQAKTQGGGRHWRVIPIDYLPERITQLSHPNQPKQDGGKS